MKPKDVIEQLVGPVEGMDQVDTFAFIFYKPIYQGEQYDFVNVNFESGIVEFCLNTEDGAQGVVHQFSIHATLEPCE